MVPSPLETWRSLGVRGRIVALALPVVAGTALIVAAVALAPEVGRVALATPTPLPTPAPPLPPTASPAPLATLLPTPTPALPLADTLLGADGRLTVLLLGSDYRPSHPGNRTDAMMVVSVDPQSGRAAAFSIPRDAVEFPLPGGGVYAPKVNGLYRHLEATTGDAGAAMRTVVGAAFDLEIDGYLFVGFQAVKEFVTAVGGVDVTLEEAYYDPAYWVTSSQRGWGLPAGTSHLDANDALIFVRSRKGDSDFGRARRQQLFLIAAAEKVRRVGLARLAQLVEIASRTTRTDLPLDRASDLLAILEKADLADLADVRRTVFGPRTYAESRGGTSFALKIDVCRAWIAANFPPAHPLEPEPTPTPETTLSPAPGSLPPAAARPSP